jgi:hypothetical protein
MQGINGSTKTKEQIYKEIKGMDISVLQNHLKKKYDQFEETWNIISDKAPRLDPLVVVLLVKFNFADRIQKIKDAILTYGGRIKKPDFAPAEETACLLEMLQNSTQELIAACGKTQFESWARAAVATAPQKAPVHVNGSPATGAGADAKAAARAAAAAPASENNHNSGTQIIAPPGGKVSMNRS